MAERPSTRRWLGRLSFTLIAVVLIFARLLPLDTMPRHWAPPDIVLAITVAWVVRRPDFLPAWLIVAIFLLCDILFQRPPGLWTLMVLILTEGLRSRSEGLRNVPFLLEWATVAVGLILIAVLNRTILAILLEPRAPLGLTLSQLALTILVYPVILLASQILFGMRRPAPGEVDGLGHPL